MDYPASRLYQLQSHPFSGFYTGRTKSGQQVLIGQYYNAILIILFTMQGTLEAVKKHVFLDTQRVPLDLTPYEREQFQASLYTQMHALDFIEQPITLQEFFTSPGVGIEPFPSYCFDFLADENAFPPEEQKWYRDLIHQWQEKENFVFYWGNDYYCNKSGEITSS